MASQSFWSTKLSILLLVFLFFLFVVLFMCIFESRARCCMKHLWILKPNMLIFYRHLVRVKYWLFRSRWQKMSTSGRLYLRTHVNHFWSKLIDRVCECNSETAAELVEHSTQIVLILEPRFTSINHRYFKMMFHQSSRIQVIVAENICEFWSQTCSFFTVI